MKLVVYTALFADESLPLEDVGRFFPFTHDKGGVEYIAFTNREDLKSDFWDVRGIEKEGDKSFRMMSRFLKWNPTKANLPEHTHSLWMDSQCYFQYEPTAIVDGYLKDKYHTAMHHHTDLQSIYVEGMVTSYVYFNDNQDTLKKLSYKYIVSEKVIEEILHELSIKSGVPDEYFNKRSKERSKYAFLIKWALILLLILIFLYEYNANT